MSKTSFKRWVKDLAEGEGWMKQIFPETIIEKILESFGKHGIIFTFTGNCI